MTVLGFGWYNYAKLQQQPAREKHGKHGGAEARRLLETEAEAVETAEAAEAAEGRAGRGEVEEAAAAEPGDALASLPPGLRAALEFAMEHLVRWGLADAVFLTASLASSLPLNLAVYVVSGVFQPLFIMEMGYAGVGKQLGLLYMLPYYAGMACVLPFASRPLRLFSNPPLPWRKLAAITTVDLAFNPNPNPNPNLNPPPTPKPNPNLNPTPTLTLPRSTSFRSGCSCEASPRSGPASLRCSTPRGRCGLPPSPTCCCGAASVACSVQRCSSSQQDSGWWRSRPPRTAAAAGAGAGTEVEAGSTCRAGWTGSLAWVSSVCSSAPRCTLSSTCCRQVGSSEQ